MEPYRDYQDREPEDQRSEEEGGGPVKSFIEHLEDLRWTLIKSISAILISMIVCMMAGRQLVALLTWPMTHSMLKISMFGAPVDTENFPIHLGTNLVGKLPALSLGVTNITSNSFKSFQIAPLLVGSNYVLALQPDVQPFEIHNSPAINSYGPMSSIMVAMKLALYGGLILSAPFVIFFVGQFVLPALHVHEKKLLYQAVGFGAGLFILGVLFCYFIIMGVALSASVEFANWLGFGADEWRAEEYIGFVTKFMLAMGISFEIPVVILVLVKIGLLDYKKLSAWRSYAIVVNLVLAAVITPSGDPFTMILFAAPLQLLYEISVWVAWSWYRRDLKKQKMLEVGSSSDQ